MKHPRFIVVGVVVVVAAVIGLLNYGVHSKQAHDDGSSQALHVVLIGLDGWGSYSLAKARMPHVQKLMDNGTVALRDQAVLPTITLPNWASMFMGAPPERHGFVDNNESIAVERLPNAEPKYGIFPTFYTLLREQQPQSTIAYFYEKPKLKMFIPERGNVFNKNERISNLSENPAGAEKVAEYIRERKPTLTMVIFREPDRVGHEVGHDTPAYYAKLEELDRYIGIIEKGIRDAGIMERTVIILSSDHGGKGRKHGADTPAERDVPLIISGKGVKKGYKLTRPLQTYDTAATIAWLFDLDTPSIWVGKPLLEAFVEEPGRPAREGATVEPQKSEAVPVPQKNETVPVPQKSETVPVPQKSETVPVPQKSETVPVPQKSEAIQE